MSKSPLFRIAAVVLLLTTAACNQIEDVCFECTAIGQNGNTTDRICESTLSQSEMNAFQADFEAQFDPSTHQVNCTMR